MKGKYTSQYDPTEERNTELARTSALKNNIYYKKLYN